MCPDADTHPSQLGTRCHTGTRCDRRSRRSQRHGLRARHRWWLPRNTSLRKLGSVALPHTRRSHPHRGELWSACTLLTVLRKAGSIFFVVCASTTLQWNSMIRKQQPQVKVACAKGWRMHISPHGAACASSSAGLGEIAKRTFLPDCFSSALPETIAAALPWSRGWYFSII